MVAAAAHDALMKLERDLRTGTSTKIQNIHYVNLDTESTVAFIKVFSNAEESRQRGRVGGGADFSPDRAAVNVDVQKTSPRDMVDRKSSGGKRQRRLKMSDAVAAESDSAGLTDMAKKQKLSTVDSDDNKGAAQATAAAADEDCVICLCPMTQPKKLACGHSFCADCINESFKKCQPKCPSCGRLFGVMKGNQPPGTMTVQSVTDSLPGFEHCGTLVIKYDIPDGIQSVSLTLKLSALILYYITYNSGDGS